MVRKNLARKAASEREAVAKELHKLQALNSGDADPHIQELRKNFEVLLAGHNEMVEASNRNAEAYSKAFQHLDLRVGALQLALDDVVRDLRSVQHTKVISHVPGLAEKVDWPAYIKARLYAIKVEMAKAQEGAKLQEAPVAAPEDSIEETSMDVVFGGQDEVQAQQSG